MDSRTNNRLLCVNEKLNYVKSVLEDGIRLLEQEMAEITEDNNELQRCQAKLNAYGNALRNLNLAISAVDSGNVL